MNISIALIALYVANEVGNKGFDLISNVIVVVVFLEFAWSASPVMQYRHRVKSRKKVIDYINRKKSRQN